MFILVSCYKKNEQFILDLNSNWEFKSSAENTFLPATVPGTVHLDLIDNNKIHDPFYRLNEHELQWIDKLDWHYKTDFEVNENHWFAPGLWPLIFFSWMLGLLMVWRA